MKFDAIVLAGGRSKRLDGADKSAFLLDGKTLLERACAAVADAERIVIVGTVDDPPTGIEVVLEDPPFGGPAAGIGAGLAALGSASSELVAVLACDLPYAAAAFTALHTEAARGFDVDALVAADDSGRRQTLLGIYRTSSLRAAIDSAGSLDGLSVRTLIAGLTFAEVTVPEGSTLDVDTWHDVEELGIDRGGAENG
ncbi:MAG: NTP transferase domain-containing protein [Actinomycetota bacterium]|nr:NTP transferase domain-containing protein [Actinomycetota bacterium]